MDTDLNVAVVFVSAGLVVFGLNLTRILGGRAQLRTTAENFLLALALVLVGVASAGVGELAQPLLGAAGFILLSGLLLGARKRFVKQASDAAPKELEGDDVRRLRPPDRDETK